MHTKRDAILRQKAGYLTRGDRKIDSSSSEDDLLLLLLLAKRKKSRRAFWVHPVNRRRREKGEFHGLVQELKLYHGRFRVYFRMSVGQFEFRSAAEAASRRG